MGKKLFGWLLILIAILVLLLSLASRDPAVGVLVGGALLVFGIVLLSLAHRSSKRLYGLVSNLRAWNPLGSTLGTIRAVRDPCDGLFDLRQTNKEWRTLEDKQGFLLPVVSVEFYARAVHGPPLEEGHRVVVSEGFRKRQRILAQHVWNTAASDVDLGLGKLDIFKGRVTNWEFPRQVPDRRYPGQNRSLEVWSFRLQRTDDRGNLLSSVPAEIRAEAIGGPLRDGDEVEISGYMVQGTLYAREVINKSLGSSLIVRDWRGMP